MTAVFPLPITTRKRKLPTVGIYDPNYSEDPQFGNVSTLKDGWKRVHLHVDGPPKGDTNYMRFQCIVPECTIPTLSTGEMQTIEEIEVVVIKNFACDAQLNVASKENLIIGICDVDKFDKTPCPNLDPEKEPVSIPIAHVEALFITNRPVCYIYHGPYKNWTQVSNFSERGYVLLQNYFNVFVMHTQADPAVDLSFNVYVDYTICRMKYKDAIAWRADFENLINPYLKYRVGEHDKAIAVHSRGDLEVESADDPSTFDDIVKSSKVFKVTERKPVEALSTEAALQTYLNKYLTDNK